MRAATWICAITATLGIGAGAAAAEPAKAEPANDPASFIKPARIALKWDEPAEPTRIVGPIYNVGTKGLGVYLIKTTKGLIVINTAMPDSGPTIEASIRALGFDPKDIELLLTAHAHMDHVGAHAYLKRISGAKVAMIQEEKALYESGGQLDFQYAGSKDFEFEPTTVDWVFHDGDMLTLGNITLGAVLTPGHTKGATTFVTHVVDDGKTYTVVFPGTGGINPGYRLVKDPSYPGIADDYQRTYRVLETLKPDIWLCPHNEVCGKEDKLARAKTEGVKAWVDPEGYRQWIARQRAAFDAQINREVGAKVQ